MVFTRLRRAGGRAEQRAGRQPPWRAAALQHGRRAARRRRATACSILGFDVKDLIEQSGPGCSTDPLRITSHVAQEVDTAIDGRTRHPRSGDACCDHIVLDL